MQKHAKPDWNSPNQLDRSDSRSREEAREKANTVAFSRFFQREKVPEGRMRGGALCFHRFGVLIEQHFTLFFRHRLTLTRLGIGPHHRRAGGDCGFVGALL